MQFSVIQKILGLLLALFSLTMLPPLLIGVAIGDEVYWSFAYAFALILSAGLCLWLPVKNIQRELKLRDGFLVVVLFWAVLGLSGAIPLMISEKPNLDFTDAAFESISGLTTTGATVIVGLDNLPKPILFYRQELQWLGGMGIIVLAVAILPILGVGGMQLYRAEIPGPLKDSKLTPRITETAKALWYIYMILTLSCAILYWAAGMTVFDSVAHSFSTVSIGGFSTHDASMGYFHSNGIKLIAIIFMFISGVNFTLHFLSIRHNNLKPYFYDSELRVYAWLLFAIFIVTLSYLLFTETYDMSSNAVIDSLFQTVSIATTTGFTTTTYHLWPTFLPVMLLLSSFVGACAGSTGGGMKVIRIILLYKQGMRELKQLVHPNSIISIKVGKRPVKEVVMNAVWSFFAAYVCVFVVLMLLLMACGLDQVTAYSSLAACLNNLGPGLGDVASHYGTINAPSKWILCLAMLFGRLEIFTLLVLFTPAFWRR